MASTQSLLEKYFANDDGRFDPNDHIDKFAIIYFAIIFVSCIVLWIMDVI